MARYGMVIDLGRCTGCQACSVACKAENNIPIVGPSESAMGRDANWIEIATETTGEYPETRERYIPMFCMHCDNPPCVKVCPVQATYIGPEGIVGQNYDRCIGCRFCVAACPYTVKTFNWRDYSEPDGMWRHANPDVSIRPVGVVEKCTFCVHREQDARAQAAIEGRDLVEGDYVPACVEACPSQAMIFGDLDDKESGVSRAADSPHAFRLLEELGTEPKVYYLMEQE